MRHQYMAGASALALICLCLLFIIFLAVPAHASSGSAASALIPLDTTTASPTDTTTPSPTDTSTPSPTVTNTPSPTDTTTPSPTVTNTPSPTATNTPSPTVTSTANPSPTRPTTTPAPSPSTTRSVFPSPATTATVGAKTSPTVAASPGASPTSTQAAGANQGPGDSSTPADNSGDSANSGSNPLANALLIILTGMGGTGLLALLFIGVRIFLRKRLVPLPSSKLPPSGAAPWSRSPASFQAQSSPYAQGGNSPFYTPNGNDTPFPGSFNGAPTLANGPGATWDGNMTPPGPYPPSTPPPAVPVGNGYGGPTQNQQPFPNMSPLLPGSVSADMMVVSDPYLQTMHEQYSQQGQVVQQAPEDLSERW